MLPFLGTILLSISVSTVSAGQDAQRYQPLSTLDIKTCGTDPKCDPQAKFRTIDGSCSNLKHPAWGQSNTPYIRTRKANYNDEKSQVRKGVDGGPLPKVRPLSVALFPDKSVPDEVHSLNLMQFGQVTAHDLTHLKRRQLADGKKVACCAANNQLLTTTPEDCLPIEVPSTDPFYKQYNVTCLHNERAATAACHKSPIQQNNANTHVLDASFVYGSDEAKARSLRTMKGGKMVVQIINGKPFPPQNPSPKVVCQNPPSEKFCFHGGDIGINLNPGMTLYNVLLLRLHNILCDRLSKINPHWDDERLYQEVRKIIDAFLQHVTYKHFLPLILGKEFMLKKPLPAEDCHDSCKSYYDPDVNPSTYNEFAGAIYRIFHSLIPRKQYIYNTGNETKDSILLEQYLLRPSIVTEKLDGILMGLVKETQQSQDRYFTVGMTQYFLRGNKDFGGDLESKELQLGRDLGLPTYNDMRETCGFKRAKNYTDLETFMNKDAIEILKSNYKNIDDIDLFTGAVMENLIPGTLVGPTSQCVVGEQFYHYYRGDRFYYENCGLPTSFTKGQRNAIFKTSVAWLFCEGGDNIKAIQHNTFLKASKDNPVVPCDKIPGLDLSSWKENKC